MTDLLVDIFFLLDILRNFRQASYSGEGKLVYTPWKIAKGYLQSWFVLDLAASFPIDWIMNTVGKQSDAANGAVLLRMLKLGKLLRLVRIIRLMKSSEAMDDDDDDDEGGGRVQRRGVVAVVKEEFAKLDLGPVKQALTWLLAGHILGCIQFMVVVQLRGTIEGTYIERAGYDTDAGGVELYLASVCHAILQLTVISAGLESPRARWPLPHPTFPAPDRPRRHSRRRSISASAVRPPLCLQRTHADALLAPRATQAAPLSRSSSLLRSSWER